MASAKQSMHHEWHTTGQISDATFKRAAQQLTCPLTTLWTP